MVHTTEYIMYSFLRFTKAYNEKCYNQELSTCTITYELLLMHLFIKPCYKLLVKESMGICLERRCPHRYGVAITYSLQNFSILSTDRKTKWYKILTSCKFVIAPFHSIIVLLIHLLHWYTKRKRRNPYKVCAQEDFISHVNPHLGHSVTPQYLH